MAIDGNVLAVTAPIGEVAQVRIYIRADATRPWSLAEVIEDPSGTGGGNGFGRSIALDYPASCSPTTPAGRTATSSAARSR